MIELARKKGTGGVEKGPFTMPAFTHEARVSVTIMPWVAADFAFLTQAGGRGLTWKASAPSSWALMACAALALLWWVQFLLCLATRPDRACRSTWDERQGVGHARGDGRVQPLLDDMPGLWQAQ